MEETSANVCTTDDSNETNNIQNKSESKNAFQCEQNEAQHSVSSDSVSMPDITINKPTTKKKAVVLNAPNVETICDDISSTTEDIKRLKHVQVRSNSTGKLYQSSRRVSFPENDSELVTGYLEPADPWACVKPATCVSELAEFYRESCRRHNAQPIESIMKHLDTLDLKSNTRRPVLNLREQNLTAESCEALEEVLKRIQYKLIDLTDCGLDDASATALFDIIEYYEAANEIDISENRNITNRGWQACINMVKRSHALQILVTRGTPLSESNAISLGKSMLASSLNTLKLEHCGLSGRPMASLCTYLRKNTVLKELWLAHNDLTADDAYNIGNVLKSNFYLQFLDLSNNNIQDRGVLHIADALIEQANYFKVLHGSSPLSTQTISSKNSLTRGEKSESKYECLARLINATNPNAEVTPKPETTVNFITTVDSTKTESDRKPESSVDSQVDKVTKSAKSDNNNSTFEESTSNDINNTKENGGRQAALSPSSPPPPPPPSVCELKIVEKIEENRIDSSRNDNDDDSSLVTSASVNSLDSNEKNSDDTNTIENVVEDNNNAGIECTTDENVLKDTEQSIELASQQPSIQLKEDLTDSLCEAQSAITTDIHLDINENKSDMKLNYAEEVKVEHTLEGQLCENKNFDIGDDISSDHIDNRTVAGRGNKMSSDLDGKVQNLIDTEIKSSDNVSRGHGCSSPKPIQSAVNNARHDDPDEEMSPVCKVRLPLNSPRLTKSKDIMSELPLTPDSSHSLDSSCEYSTPFEAIRSYNSAIVPERSFSSESLNSETSIESNDSKSSIKLAESKFSKNGTLERQNNSNLFVGPPSITTPNGLQVLVLWNSRITRDSAQSISKLLSATTTLEILNVGKNVLSNDFVANIKTSLKSNTSLTSLGLQSVHLSNDGVKTLSEILDFGGNVTLQRIDLRDNNLQVSGLQSLNEVLKSNKSITRIDLDDIPRRVYEHSSDSSIDYSRVVNNIRSLCARNENPPEPEPIRTSVKRVRANFLNSRKISLTCQSIRNSAHDSPQAKAERLLDPARKSGRLRSPSPSPIPSPVSSPIPSPSRSSRFHVSRVIESNVSSPITPPSSNSCSPTSNSSSSRFRVTVVEPPKVMSAPVTIINSTNKENDKSVQYKKETDATAMSQTILQRTQSAPTSSIMSSTTSSTSPSPAATAMAAPVAVAVVAQPIHHEPTSIETNTVQPKDTREYTVSKPTDQQPITTTLTVIDNPGNSFDSPDLEVKCYMDDSCSSFSSLDSIDRGQDFNTSFSSMESYEILRDNKFPTEFGKQLQTPHQNQNKNIINKNITNSPTENVNPIKVESSTSSLEASTCSNDSIYGSQEFPVLKISSNEGTLTNSPVSPCSGDIPSNPKDNLSPKPDDKQQRVRKTSWISRGEAVPATLDKLLSIFHHPSNLFFPRSSNGDVAKKEPQQQLPVQTQIQTQTQAQASAQPQAPAQAQAQAQAQTQENKPPSRKESPSGLFAWTKKENVFGEMLESKANPTEVAGQKVVKPPLQSNISPENTITADSVGIEAIPMQLKQDVKENTSPEHTVTADSMANLQSKTTVAQTLCAEISPKIEKTLIDIEKQATTALAATTATATAISTTAALAAASDKVYFEVGGDDDEDEYDDSNKTEFTGVQVNGPDGSNQAQSYAGVAANRVGKAFGLGQITRDSLSILKGSSNNSQDSMRSLESLSEIVFEET